MNDHHFSDHRRAIAGSIVALGLTISVALNPAAGMAQSDSHHGATPTATASATPWSCDMTPGMGSSRAATPMAMDDAAGMTHGDYPFDQLYIDMMIPHHESIIALAEAALPRLTDPRLVQIAEAIIAAQTGENAQMAAWREAWYGSPTPDLGEHSMMAMQETMPVGTMDEMMQEMDATAQVATFCAAADPDLAFIDQAIPHHLMAIAVSRIALEQAEHPEIRETAQAVIDAQQAEIDELTAIRADLTGEATPAD